MPAIRELQRQSQLQHFTQARGQWLVHLAESLTLLAQALERCGYTDANTRFREYAAAISPSVDLLTLRDILQLELARHQAELTGLLAELRAAGTWPLRFLTAAVGLIRQLTGDLQSITDLLDRFSPDLELAERLLASRATSFCRQLLATELSCRSIIESRSI